jgi:DNA-binding transcriptional ArsR family regulator
MTGSSKGVSRLYTLAVDFAPAHELLVSFSAYTVAKHHRLMDLGPAWVRRVREGLPEGFGSRLAGLGEQDLDRLLCFGQLLAWKSPAKDDAASFLTWCASLASGDMYELAAAWYAPTYAIPANLGEMRDCLLDLLGGWDERYFSHLDQAIVAGLTAQADSLRRRITAHDSPQALVEEVSNGVVLLPAPEVATVVLVPQYHLRPWNLLSPYRGTTILCYPQEAGALAPGEPHAPLLRAAKALGDASRLRMMRFLAESQRSFTEIVTELGLANSTVNYHLGLLRAAGLVRILTDAACKGAPQYALRQPALRGVLDGLAEFVRLGAGIGHRLDDVEQPE